MSHTLFYLGKAASKNNLYNIQVTKSINLYFFETEVAKFFHLQNRIAGTKLHWLQMYKVLEWEAV